MARMLDHPELPQLSPAVRAAVFNQTALAGWRRDTAGDLDQAIAQWSQARELVTDDRADHANNLAGALRWRFYRGGEMADLEGAIATYAQSLALGPDADRLRGRPGAAASATPGPNGTGDRGARRPRSRAQT
jgi:hypothetical protein